MVVPTADETALALRAAHSWEPGPGVISPAVRACFSCGPPGIVVVMVSPSMVAALRLVRRAHGVAINSALYGGRICATMTYAHRRRDRCPSGAVDRGDRNSTTGCPGAVGGQQR